MKLRKTYIEITNVCNLSCPFCGGTERARQFMDPALFARILEEIQGLSRHLYFHVMGEPLLHPQIGHFLALCAPYGYKVHLVTNGSQLAALAPTLLDKAALHQVAISLHSLEHTRSDAAIDAFLLTVADFAQQAAARGGLWVVLRLWNGGSRDPAQAGTNQRILRSLQRVLDLSSPLALAGRGDGVIRLASNLSLEFAPSFEWPDPALPLQGAVGTCYGVRDQCAILVDGTVVPCCLDRNAAIALGSVTQNSLREILAGERASRMRTGFSRRLVVEDLCRRCTFRLSFDREPAAEQNHTLPAPPLVISHT